MNTYHDNTLEPLRSSQLGLGAFDVCFVNMEDQSLSRTNRTMTTQTRRRRPVSFDCVNVDVLSSLIKTLPG